jgi:hypothetical protein
MKIKLLALTASLAFASAAHTAVTYDADGNGFVGKGDVQSLYDWNNSMLQEHADSVRFRILSPSGASWKCQGINPGGQTVTFTERSQNEAVESDVSHSARRNAVGQVTGFLLNGVAAYSVEFGSIGVCPSRNPNWQQQPVLFGDIDYEGTGEPMLQVSIDGVDWYDLPLTD